MARPLLGNPVLLDLARNGSAPQRPAARSRGPRSRLRPLVLILLGGLAVRLLLVYAFTGEPLHIWDELDYDKLARNLLTEGTFAFEAGGPPTSLRPPLYPAFLAAVYAVAGVGNYSAVRLVQVVLGLLTVVVMYGFNREVTSPRRALWAAGLCCFYPSLLAYDCLLLTEILFTFLLCSACYLVVLTWKRESVAFAGAAGAVLGLAALTRSIVWLAPPLLAIFLLLACRCGWGRRLAVAAVLVVAFVATIAPWSIRNSRLQQSFVVIDTMGGRNFMMGNYRYTPLYRSWDAIAIEGEQSWVNELFTNCPPAERKTQGQVDKAALKLGLRFVYEHPGLTMLRSFVKFFDFWGLERELVAGTNRGFFGATSTTAIVGVAAAITGSYALVILLAIFGAVFAPPEDRRAHWLILCVVGFVCALHVVVFGHSRYHLPLIPLVLVYTAGAVIHLGDIWRQRRGVRFVIAAGLSLLLIAGWAWTFVAVDWDRLPGLFHPMA